MGNPQTYEEWEREMLDDYNPIDGRSRNTWLALGNWLYSAKTNSCFGNNHVVYHVCQKNYERVYAHELGYPITSYEDSISNVEIGCATCKAEVPEGWKMIMMLEKL